MLRPWFAFAKILFIALFTASAVGQTSSTQNHAASAPSAQAATAAPEAESDSADIPAIARDRISEEEYFTLRDQQIGMQRGIGDLVRDPLLRSKAIRTMELQEFFLRRLREGGARLGALAPAATNTWTPLGPAPIPNGQTSGTEVPVSGRVTAIAIDPLDSTANTVYVGTAQGGLYRTLDGGATWTPLMDSAPSLAIGALAFDPIDHTTLFVGTGEGNNSGDSFFGVGLFIIRNATTTADVSGPFNLSTTGSDVFTGRSITQILVSPADDNKVLVSTGSGFSGLSFDTFIPAALPTRGVYLSTNAMGPAPTFAQQQAPNLANHIVSDMVMDPANPAKVLVHIVGGTGATDGGVWESTAGDPFAGTATWTQTFGEASLTVGKFAVNHVGSTTTFALANSDNLCGTAGEAGVVRKSLDGLTWAEIASARGFCGGQCVYDAPIAIDPSNANVMYIGGNADSGSTSALTCGSAALAKATDGATFNRSDSRLHADSHVIAIAPSNSSIIYTGNDGGIFKSTDAGVTWSSLNNSSFSATQFQSLALHPADANFMIGGTQDNGTEFMNSAGTWTRSDGGDGGYALIDQSSPDTTNVTMYHTYFNQTGGAKGFIGYARVTNIANATEAGWTPFFGCPATAGSGITANGISCTDQVLFYAPMALGPGSPNTLYFGTDHLYRSADQGATMTSVSQAVFAVNATTGLNVPVSAVGISPQNDQVRIVGLTNGQVFATTSGANPIPAVTGPWGAHYVARAVVDPTNSNTAYITLDGYGFPSHVWKTTNLNAANPTWVVASGALPDVPVNAFAIDPVFPNNLFAGTDVGVFSSTDGGTTWAPYGTGLPRVAVFDMAINKVSRKLRIATHGKGIWEIAVVNPAGSVALAASSSSVATGTAVTLTASVVQNPSLPLPTGTITFNDGATALGNPVALDGTGTATLQTSSLGNGTHSITAGYSGDANYAASSSAAVVVDVGAADYAVTVPNGAATINAGQSATFTINIAPQHGFSAAVAFSCSGLPTGAACAFNPASVTPNGAAASSTLTITTTSRLVASAAPGSTSLAMFLASGSLFEIGLVVVSAGKKRRWQPVCLMLMMAGVLVGLVACGGGSSTPNPPPVTGTPAGTFTVAVTATSGSTTHQSNITLTVR